MLEANIGRVTVVREKTAKMKKEVQELRKLLDQSENDGLLGSVTQVT